jgi:hypothetical protein
VRFPALLALCLSTSVAIAPGQVSKPAAESATRPAKWDLRLSGDSRPVLVEVNGSRKGLTSVKAGDTVIIQPIDWKYQARWIDELADSRNDPIVDRRTFIEVRKTHGGRIVLDPGFEGITLVMTRSGNKGTVALEGGGQRTVLKTEMNKQVAQVHATGLLVGLPMAEAEIGVSYELKAAQRTDESRLAGGQALFATLLDLEDEVEGWNASVALDRVNTKTKRAYLSGNVSFTEVGTTWAEKSYAAAYRGTFTMELDLERREMTKVTVKGGAKITGRGTSEGAVSGEVTFESTATTKPVKDVAALKPRNPSFRENVHEFSGIQFRLPSCWITIPAEKPRQRRLLDSRVKPELVIDVGLIDLEGDPGTDDFVKNFTDVLRKDYGAAKVTKTSFSTGKGVAYEFKNAEGLMTRGGIAPFGEATVSIRLTGTPEAVGKADPDLKLVMSSFKKAPQ